MTAVIANNVNAMLVTITARDCIVELGKSGLVNPTIETPIAQRASAPPAEEIQGLGGFVLDGCDHDGDHGSLPFAHWRNCATGAGRRSQP